MRKSKHFLEYSRRPGPRVVRPARVKQYSGSYRIGSLQITIELHNTTLNTQLLGDLESRSLKIRPETHARGLAQQNALYFRLMRCNHSDLPDLYNLFLFFTHTHVHRHTFNTK